MAKRGKTGRPGKRRRNMPGYYLGVNKIGHKSWFAMRRPEDIKRTASRYNFLNGEIKPGAIFTLSRTSNAVFLGIHRGRILYYNPKTDRVGHTGLGRFRGPGRTVSILKEEAGLDYFKSENGWMNHRKIPGSDLKVSDVLINPYRKTIAKKPGDKFTMVDYHQSAIVGDVLLGNDSGLKAEVIAITKRGMTVKVDDGTPEGRIGQINLKNRAYLERQYTLVKSALVKDTSVKDLQKKVSDFSYDTVQTDKGGSVAVRRGRPAGSANRPLTEEEIKTFRTRMNKDIESLTNIETEDPRKHLELAKKIISYSNKIGDEEINKTYKKLRQQLNYKIVLHEKYEEAQTPQEKLSAAKAALKYEERIDGRESAKNLWRERIALLREGSGEPSKKPVEQTEQKEQQKNIDESTAPKKVIDSTPIESTDKTETNQSKKENPESELRTRLDEEAKNNENNMMFTISQGWVEQDRPSDIENVRSSISRIENMLSTNAYEDGRALESTRRVILLGQRRGLYERLKVLSQKEAERQQKDEKETEKPALDFQSKIKKEIEEHQNSEKFKLGYKFIKDDSDFYTNSDGTPNTGRVENQISIVEGILKNNVTPSGLNVSKSLRVSFLGQYKALTELLKNGEKSKNDSKPELKENKENENKKPIEINDDPNSQFLNIDKFKGYKRLERGEIDNFVNGDKFFAYDTYSNKIIEVKVEGSGYGKKFTTPVLEKGVPTDKASISLNDLRNPTFKTYVPLIKSDNPDESSSKWHSLATGDMLHINDGANKGVYRVSYSDNMSNPIAYKLNGTGTVKLSELNDDSYEIIKTPKSPTSPLNILRNIGDETHIVTHTDKGNLALTIKNHSVNYDTNSKSLKITMKVEDADGKEHSIDIDGDNISKNNILDLNSSISTVKITKTGHRGNVGTILGDMESYGLTKAMSHMCVPGAKNNIFIDSNYGGNLVRYENKLSLNGQHAGEIIRTFNKTMAGKRKIHNDLFRVPSVLQGDGLAQRVYDNQTKLAKKLGINYIDMLCALDVGGYAWATKNKGFDFQTRATSASFRNRLLTAVQSMILDDWQKFHPTATMEIMKEQKEAIINELNKKKKDARGNDTGKYYYDTAKAHEFAEFSHSYLDENGKKVVVGRKRGQAGNRDDRLHHLGKAIMLGSSWNGIKKLDLAKYNKPEWDISTIEAPTPEVYTEARPVKA